MQQFDIVIVGAGTAGIPAAIEAVQTGANVLLIEQSDRIGGTLHVSAGQMSAAGTELQRARGIADSVAAHVQEAIRISRNTCDVSLVEKAAALAAPTFDWLMGMGFDPAGLAETIAAYNTALADGAPDPLGRQHRPAAVATAPLRAIRMHGIILKTPAGLAIDTELRVLNTEGKPIPNLYTIGEAMGGAALSGNAFVGGMSVTPALSFGRWIGQTLGHRHTKAAA